MRINQSEDPEVFGSALQSLSIGMRVQLRAQRDSGAVEHFSSLIGSVKDEFLMVKLPMVRNTPIMFPDDELITVRAFTGTTIFSFATIVMRTFLSPLYYMHLAYPREIERSMLRTEFRVRVNMSASVEYMDLRGARTSARVSLANLSVSGAAISGEVLLGVGQRVRLSFAIHSDGMERGIRVEAIVRSVHRKTTGSGEKSATVFCGMEFQNLDADDQTVLRLLIYETILADRTSFV